MKESGLEKQVMIGKQIKEFMKKYTECARRRREFCDKNGHHSGTIIYHNRTTTKIYCPHCNTTYNQSE